MQAQISTPGIAVGTFFRSISEVDLRRFVDDRVLSVIDALFGGHISVEDLRQAVLELVDFGELLRDPEKRDFIVRLIPVEKRLELSGRLGRTVSVGSGDRWSRAEVETLCEFFGIVDEDDKALPGRFTASMVMPGYGLFEYQRVVVGKLMALLAEDDRRAVLHLPTGAGKTRLAMHVVANALRRNEPAVVVWLASGRELIDQAINAFRDAWLHLGIRPLRIETMHGEELPDIDGFGDGFLAVGLSKGWSHLRTDPEWATRLARRVCLVVFDEAHQVVAQTYRRIADDLTLDYRCGLLGLTATPGRTWADIDADGRLAEYFCGNKVTLDVPDDNPIAFLVDNGFLARPTFRTLLARSGLNVDEGEVDRISRALEIPQNIVADLSMSERYVAAVLHAIEELLGKGHRRVLVFSATVTHTRMLTAVLVARGICSEAVTGLTPVRARERAIRAFKADDEVPMVLVNFGVLTTGFDAPRASAAVIARPTKSLVLYSQMVGRVIRGPKAGGTDACEIVTVVDPSLPGFGDVADAFLNWEDVW